MKSAIIDRKSFEDWLNQNCTFTISLGRDEDDSYLDDAAQLAWLSWQEACKIANAKHARKRKRSDAHSVLSHIKRMSGRKK